MTRQLKGKADMAIELCRCAGWARIPDGSKLPMSLHHPACDQYVLTDFVKVSANGGHCVVEVREAKDFDAETYTKTLIRMTRDQFENLREFEGF